MLQVAQITLIRVTMATRLSDFISNSALYVKFVLCLWSCVVDRIMGYRMHLRSGNTIMWSLHLPSCFSWLEWDRIMWLWSVREETLTAIGWQCSAVTRPAWAAWWRTAETTQTPSSSWWVWGVLGQEAGRGNHRQEAMTHSFSLSLFLYLSSPSVSTAERQKREMLCG